ncbi:MAG: sigma-70 family RNA polymerase sigma factor, partial [Candidatus Aminicenantes bacterium]|nr:sigma-70 family RNA polymerase sigma factor [Candidatus Aminicenantes bacterium]
MRQLEQRGDSMLIRRAKDGDMDAFETLVKKYQKPIYVLCRRMTGQHQSADDLSQETFIKAYLSLQKFKDEKSFFSWIRKIALNNSLNYLKKRKREEPLGIREINATENLNSSPQELPHEQLLRKNMEANFKEALEALPLDQKTVFILRVFENLSYKAIADLLNIPKGTVMSQLSRA